MRPFQQSLIFYRRICLLIVLQELQADYNWRFSKFFCYFGNVNDGGLDAFDKPQISFHICSMLFNEQIYLMFVVKSGSTHLVCVRTASVQFVISGTFFLTKQIFASLKPKALTLLLIEKLIFRFDLWVFDKRNDKVTGDFL